MRCFTGDLIKLLVAALDSGDVKNKINYYRLLGELCRKSPEGHATALGICDQLKVCAYIQVQ